MIKQNIELGADDWNIIVYYGVEQDSIEPLVDDLRSVGCPENDIIYGLDILTSQFNSGMTFTNTDYKTSIVCIGNATSAEQFVNTVIHESKHVQSHICDYYNIREDGEQAAYLIGYIVQRMYRMLRYIKRKYYGRF